MEIPQNAKRPGDYRRPAPSDDDFIFEHDGQQYRIPPASTVKIGTARKWADLPESTQILKLLEHICDEDTMAAIDDMDGKEFARMHEKWQRKQMELAQATQGESKA